MNSHFAAVIDCEELERGMHIVAREVIFEGNYSNMRFCVALSLGTVVMSKTNGPVTNTDG
jgi:hypothetical protein